MRAVGFLRRNDGIDGRSPERREKKKKMRERWRVFREIGSEEVKRGEGKGRWIEMEEREEEEGEEGEGGKGGKGGKVV